MQHNRKMNDMTTNKKSLSFGRYLQDIRLSKGISLETVAEETKIRLDNLLLIEGEKHDKLPDEVFVKGFLRAYAKAIGADEDEAVRRYQIRLKVVKKLAKAEADLKMPDGKFWRRLLLCIGGLLCLIFLSVFAVSVLNKRSSSTELLKTNIEQPADIENEGKATFEPQYDPEPATVESTNKPEKLILKITAIEETWMKIIVDGQKPNEYYLKPGDQVELEATLGYNLFIGNAGGIRLLLNSQPIAVPGKSGQVVNLKIP
jgi:cytoskeletal protein RodZ